MSRHDESSPTHGATAYEMPAPVRSGARGLAIGALIGVITTGAALATCAGQTFNRRQARALEGIQRRLEAMPLEHCPESPRSAR